MRITWSPAVAGVVVALGVAASSLSAQTPPSAVASHAGCYTMTMGDWSAPFPSRSPDLHRPPPTFRLDTTRANRSFGDYAVTPNIPSLGDKTQPGWRLKATDSVEIIWSSGHAGVTLSMKARGDSLVGRARSFTDVIMGPEPTAPVTAVRIDCAALTDGAVDASLLKPRLGGTTR